MERIEPELKRLEFVRVIALNTLLCALNLFDYAKQNSGSLKSVVGRVENAVTPVVAPVFEKFKDLPGQFLLLLDDKVDEAAKKFNSHAPIIAKRAVSVGVCMIQKASEEVKVVVKDIQVGGASAGIQRAAALFKQLFVWSSVRFYWYLVNNINPCNSFALKAIPFLAQCSDKYNETVTGLAAKGFVALSYFPIVPVEEMEVAYNQFKTASSSATAADGEKSGTKDE